MKFTNPLRRLSKFELALWLTSAAVVSASFFLCGERNWLTLAASLVGVTALIFVSRGDVLGQILTVAFSILYAVISFDLRYYGEMITYLGMSAPIAVASVITWLRHPYSKEKSEVQIHRLSKKQALLTVILTAAVTFGFYFILAAFNTANLPVSTVSVATSFSASFLMMLRSKAYALAYAANDVVLIVLWVLASVENLSYLAMVLCFVMFLCNDIYAFFNWRRMSRRQSQQRTSGKGGAPLSE